MDTNQRTIQKLRAAGLVCEVVQRWQAIPGSGGVRKDLFGFIDVLYLQPGRGVVAVQAISSGEKEAHLRKIRENDKVSKAAEAWMMSGNPIEIWAWAKKNRPNGVRGCLWDYKVIELSLRDIC